MKYRFLLINLLLAVVLPLRAQPKPDNFALIDKVIGRVDNHIILLSDLESMYYQLRGENPNQTAFELRCEVMNQLVMNKMLLAQADLDSVVVSGDIVNSQLDRRMDFMVNQLGGDAEKLEEYYGKSLEEIKTELRYQVREQMVLEKMRNEITAGQKVTPRQVRQFYNSLDPDSVPYLSREVEVAQLVMLPKPNPKVKNEVREMLGLIRKKIVDGDRTFAEAAQIYHQGNPQVRQAGGQLPWSKMGQMAPEFEAAVRQLSPGEISGIVETEFGLHLIQLNERKGDKYRASHILLPIPATDDDLAGAVQELNRVARLINSDSITFEQAVKKYSEDDMSKSNGGFIIDRQTNSRRMPLDQLDSKVFFVIDTMEVGQISQPVQFTTDRGKPAARLIWLKSEIPPHRANLEDDFQRIHQVAQENVRYEALEKWFDNKKENLYISIDLEYRQCEALQELMRPE